VTGALTANGNVILGDASTDTLNVGNGGLVKDASGNVGIGVTPKAWESSYKVLSIGFGGSIFGRTSAGEVTLSGNLYRNTAGTWKYINAGGGTLFIAGGDSTYTWYNVATGGSADGNATLNPAMTLDSSGNLLVGTTSVLYGTSKTNIYNANASSGADACLTLKSAWATGAGTFVNGLVFQDAGGTIRGYVSWNNSSTSYVTSSDYRLKHDIQPMTGALAKVAQLKPVTYKWNVDDSESQGFIAHELQAVVPECVTGEKDAVDAEGKPQYQGIDTSFLVATLTAAIQEQQALITQLQADVAALKGNA
jgi:hypothetical protein